MMTTRYNKHFRLIVTVFFTFYMALTPLAQAQISDSLSLRKDDPTFKSGSVYYSTSKKNELTMRTNIWGAVQFPGVHFIPIGTRFIDAISIAGGPNDIADLADVTLTSKETSNAGQVLYQKLSLNDALAKPEFNPVLKPDDVIFVKSDHSREKAQLWLSVGTFILSVAAFGLLLDQNNRSK